MEAGMKHVAVMSLIAMLTGLPLLDAEASQRRLATGQAALAPAFAPPPPRRPQPSPVPSRKPVPPPAPARSSTPAAPDAISHGPEDGSASACRIAFATTGAQLLPNPPGIATGSCSVPDAVTFKLMGLPDGPAVALESPATTRCTFALELAAWLREDLAPIFARTGARPAAFAGVGSHECRLRNRQSAGPVSEHASGNALDLRALVLTNGKRLALTGADPATKSLREAIRASACARFATVLGPGSDGFHEDHVHVDMRSRNSAYRLCRWRVD